MIEVKKKLEARLIQLFESESYIYIYVCPLLLYKSTSLLDSHKVPCSVLHHIVINYLVSVVKKQVSISYM